MTSFCRYLYSELKRLILMPKQSKQNSIDFIACPACGGAGAVNGRRCQNCNGIGLGVFSFGKFYYWLEEISQETIVLRHVQKTLDALMNLAALVFGAAGFVSLGYWLSLAGPAGLSFSSFFHKNIFLFVFWLSIFADMFVVFRLSRDAERTKKIRQALYPHKKKKYDLPNNWDELVQAGAGVLYNTARAAGEEFRRVIEDAYLCARKAGAPAVSPIHIFSAALKDKKTAVLFLRLSVDPVSIRKKIGERLAASKKKAAGAPPALFFDNGAKEAIVESFLNAQAGRQARLEPVDLVLPLAARDKYLFEFLYDIGIDREKIANCLAWQRIDEKLLENYRHYREAARYKPGGVMDRAYTAVATPVLDHFSYDLTRAAKWGRLDFCVAREKEIESLFEHVDSGHNGVLFCGQPGVGKKTLVYGIAESMVSEDVPEAFKDKRLIKLDITRLVSGAAPAEAQERMVVVFDEIARAGNIILYIEDIENIIGIAAGAEGSLDLSKVFTEALDRRSFFCLATTTSESYRKMIEKTHLAQAMVKIDVEEPEKNQAIQIIESHIGRLEGRYHIYFTYHAIEKTVELSDRYIHDKFLPEKAIEILETIAVRTLKSKGENSLVLREDVEEAVSDATHIPLAKVSENEGEKLLHLEERIHERMVGQEEAVEMAAASLRRARVNLKDAKRPIANFLFLGPTGVGKTELAKTIAAEYFSSEDAMIRLDMSEYQYAESVTKMIGDADENSAGYLTEAVRRAPFSLILLDEFEKAHPNILNLFLQVMDDGRLTDGHGRTIDFSNCIIIATSNAGALYIEEQVKSGANIELIKKELIEVELNKVMRPELINRFDGVIVFKPLTIDNVAKIAELMLNKVAAMLEEKGMTLRFGEAAVHHLARLGFDPKFGARPLRRVIQDKIENAIANLILAGRLKRRDAVVIGETGELAVEKAAEF